MQAGKLLHIEEWAWPDRIEAEALIAAFRG
jgi:hypothetical protein